MSSVIKLGKGNANVKVRMNEHTGFGNFDTESEDEYLERIEEEKHQQIFNAGREDAIRLGISSACMDDAMIGMTHSAAVQARSAGMYLHWQKDKEG